MGAVPQKLFILEVNTVLHRDLFVMTLPWLKRSLAYSTGRALAGWISSEGRAAQGGSVEPLQLLSAVAKPIEQKLSLIQWLSDRANRLRTRQILACCLGETPKSESWGKEGVLYFRR